MPTDARRGGRRPARRWGSSTSTCEPQRGGAPYLAAGEPDPAGATPRSRCPMANGPAGRRRHGQLGRPPAAGHRRRPARRRLRRSAEPDLQRLLDRATALTRSATQALPQTVKLIDDGSTVLATQQASSAAIRSFSRNLALLSGTLAAHDDDLGTILDQGTLASAQVTKLLQDNRTGISTLLTNLVTVGQVTATNNAGLRQILVDLPRRRRGCLHRAARRRHRALRAGPQRQRPPAVPGRATAARTRTDPDPDHEPAAAEHSARTARRPSGSSTDVRGAQHAQPTERAAEP